MGALLQTDGTEAETMAGQALTKPKVRMEKVTSPAFSISLAQAQRVAPVVATSSTRSMWRWLRRSG